MNLCIVAATGRAQLERTIGAAHAGIRTCLLSLIVVLFRIASLTSFCCLLSSA